MTDRSADDAEDLAWLADRLLLAELDPIEEEAVLGRLEADEAFAAAVARASRLVALVSQPAPQPARIPLAGPKRARAAAAVAAAVAAAIGFVAWLGKPVRPAVRPGPREVLAVWRQAADAELTEGEAPAEDDPAEGDRIPDWLLTAVAIDAGFLDDSGIREN